MLLPNEILLFYGLQFLFDVEFTGFLSVIGFVMMFRIISGGVNYILNSIKKYFSKEV
jgi:hypothetical protein